MPEAPIAVRVAATVRSLLIDAFNWLYCWFWSLNLVSVWVFVVSVGSKLEVGGCIMVLGSCAFETHFFF